MEGIRGTQKYIPGLLALSRKEWKKWEELLERDSTGAVAEPKVIVVQGTQQGCYENLGYNKAGPGRSLQSHFTPDGLWEW